MIKICDGFNTNIKILDNYIQLYSYDRLSIHPGKTILLKLPYFRPILDKYLNYQLTKQLILKGLSLKWSNINNESSKTCVELIVKNDNIDTELDRNSLTSIIGSGKKIEILPNTPLIKIFTF